MRYRTLGLLLFVIAPILHAQAPDDCKLTFVGTARKDVKLRAPSLAATYTAFGSANAPKSIGDWFTAACTWEAKRPATIPAKTAIPGLEDQVATLQGYLLAVKFEAGGDHDFHMELSDDADWTKSKHVIVEVPPGDPYCTARTAAWSLVTKDAGASTPANTYVFAHPPLVQVQGFVFFDSAHAVPNGCDDNGGRGIHNNGAPSMVRGIWEVHPVISITQTKPGATEAFAKKTAPDTTTTTDTSGTQGSGQQATTTAQPPRAPAKTTPPGTLWYVSIKIPLNTKDRTLTVIRDADVNPQGNPTSLKVSDDIAVMPALKQLQPGDEAYLRVNKDTITRVEQLPTSATERTVSMIIIGGVFLIVLGFGRRILRGADGLYSKSKFQLALWFSILVLAYLSTGILRWRVVGSGLFGDINVPKNLAILSGISAFTFGAAKAIRVAQVRRAGKQPAAGGAPAAQDAPTASSFFRDLFVDDAGNPDIGDIQMLILTLLAVVVYVIQLWSWQGYVPVYSPVTLPDVDTTILATMGLGQGAYLFKKQAGDPQPPPKVNKDSLSI